MRALRARPGGVLLAQRRRRVPWGELGRERILAAWSRLVREHVVPAEQLRLLGVFGPAPLGAVAAIAYDPDRDRALIALRRTRVPGPAGDLALARHLPTGRLLTTAVAPPPVPGRTADRRGHHTRPLR